MNDPLVRAGPGRRLFMQTPEKKYHLGVNSSYDSSVFTLLLYEAGESSPSARVELSRHEAKLMAGAILDTISGMVYERYRP